MIFGFSEPPSPWRKRNMERPAERGARFGVAFGEVADRKQQRRQELAAGYLARPMPNSQDLMLGVRELLGGNLLIGPLDAKTAHDAQTTGPDKGTAPLSSLVVLPAQSLDLCTGEPVIR